MGLDISFHPIAPEELDSFVFAVLADPNLAPAKAREITDTPAKQEQIEALYQDLLAVYGDVQAGRDEFPTLSLGIAGIAGYLHPYWYARGACIGFLGDEDEAFLPLQKSLISLAPKLFSDLRDESGGQIMGNFMGGGYIAPGRLHELQDLLDDPAHEEAVTTVFAEESLDALDQAITYARRHRLGLMEAADLVVPSEEEVFSDPANLRAHFLDNEGDLFNARFSGNA